MKVFFDEMKEVFKTVLLSLSFKEERAELCARIFAENSRDGVYSHGLNRFPVFVDAVKDKQINIHAEPDILEQQGSVERWDGNLAPGMYTASLAMKKAVTLAKQFHLGCVAVRNTNHWMRGGTYGWQAADAGCIGICTSNTIANMPPHGGRDARLGNNPLVIAVPRASGHIVLDMAMSQFSYGKLQEYQLKGQQLPVFGGYDQEGALSTDPEKIAASKRTLPIGFWKGSGLSFILDVLVSSLSSGRTVKQITADKTESGLSQLFLCIDGGSLNDHIADEIIQYTKSSASIDGEIYYPGEKTLATRLKNQKEGIPVNEEIWKKVLSL